jgi:hypothetical protein
LAESKSELGTEQIERLFSVAVNRLERQCDICDGEGGWKDGRNGKRSECADCEGTGFVLTELGEQIYSFMRRLKSRVRVRSRRLARARKFSV